ncbi:MAG: LemA family protein [Bacilli bacterium]|nr:LemA family protein [Bacilli bacterium]
MKKGTIILVVIVAIVAIIIGSLVSSYNNLVSLEEKVDKTYSDIDVQLERRADLIPNLVNTVKGYVEHEESVIKNITDARENLLKANTVEEKSKANNELSSAIDALMVIVENYPDLKANQNFINLSDELSGTENRIANARNEYNEAVSNYNSARKKFPVVLIASMFGFEEKDYFEVDESKTEVPDVEF